MIESLFANFMLERPSHLCRDETITLNVRKPFYILFVQIIKIHGLTFSFIFVTKKFIVFRTCVEHIFDSKITLFRLSESCLILKNCILNCQQVKHYGV